MGAAPKRHLLPNGRRLRRGSNRINDFVPRNPSAASATAPERAITVDKPSVSVVIPSYSEELYLPDCLDAAMLALAGKASEIIVVDNNSTDRTRQIVARYPGVIYVFEGEKGVTRARQCGFLASTGDIVAYLDADTRPLPGWIEQIWTQFASDEQMACLSGPYTFYDLGGVRRFVSEAWFLVARTLYAFTGHLVVGGNFAIRRSALVAMGGFDKTIEFYGEDVDIGRRAKMQGRVHFSPTLKMPTSGRRMAKQGFAAMASIYLANYLSVSLRGRPATSEYIDVR